MNKYLHTKNEREGFKKLEHHRQTDTHTCDRKHYPRNHGTFAGGKTACINELLLIPPTKQQGNVFGDGIWVYMYVFLSCDNFRQPWRRKFIFVSREYGPSSYTKVIGSASRSQEQNAQNSLFLSCKTSMGNNSDSVEDRSVKCACSMGFSTVADRMVWLPFLSRDRTWPRLTKYTHSRVVDLRLEGNPVIIIMVIVIIT